MKQFAKTVLILLTVLCLCAPLCVQAAGRVKVRYKGATKTYSQKITTVYINGKKNTIASSPIFMKSGAYMGPVSKLFVNSDFKVKCKKSGPKIMLTYKKRKLVMKDGSTNVILNGVYKKRVLGASPMKDLVYSGSSTKRWVVPLYSVCKRLGIRYKVKNGAVYLGDASQTISTSDQTTESSTSTDTDGSISAGTGGLSSGDSGTDGASSGDSGAGGTSSSKKFVLVLDAGHGGVDSGAVGKLYKEKNLNLAIVLAAKKYFDKDDRFKVYYTRTADTYPSLDGRCQLANDNNADLFICVHNNSASSTSATGTETLYNNSRNGTTKKNGLTSKGLATYIQGAVVSTTGFANRGLVNRTGLRVLNKTNMPACLIEYGFISNPTQEKVIHANTTRYGKGLYKAIVSYLKTNRKIK